MAYQKGKGCQPITSKIKHSTKGGMKVEQPLIGEYAPVQMNSPAKNIIVRGAGQLIKAGAKRALPAIRKGGAEALKKGKDLLGKGAAATTFVPKKSLKQRAGRFIKNAITGGIGYAAIDAIFGGGNDKPAETKPTVTPKPETTTKKKPYVKPGGKATGSMKNYKIGSKERYDEYEARGWAHDDTTKGYKPKKEAKASTIKPSGVEPAAKPQPKVSIETKVPEMPSAKPSKKDLYTAKKKGKAGARKTAKAADKEAQAKKALAEGNTRKAARKQRSADRKKAKAKKKFSQAAQAIEVKSPAMKKGSKKY